MNGPLIRYAGDIPLIITIPAAGASTSDDRARIRAHLDDYLPGPAGDRRMDGYRITVCTSPAPARAAVADWADPAQTLTPVPGVVLTQSLTDDGWRRYTLHADALEHRPGAWAVQIRGTAIELYTNGPGHAPRYLLRLIREVMLRNYENIGGIVFHAAGLTLPEGAIMICGPRGAGKTTTLAALLTAAQQPTGRQAGRRAALLSNDRLILSGEHRLVAVPLPVPLARGTLESFPQLAARSPVPVDGLSARFGSRDKTTLPARAFAAAFNAELAAAAHARLLLIPALTNTDQPPRLHRLTGAETNSVLNASCFTPVDEFWSPWLVPHTATARDLAAGAAAACARLPKTLPAYRVHFGIRRPIAELTAALAALIGESRT